MDTLSTTVSQQIARGAAALYEAFIDPAIITSFWLDQVSGPLEPKATVRWSFMVPGATETVTVVELTRSRRIVFDWSDGIRVRIDFDERSDGTTVVSINAAGFAKAEQVVNATEGFSIVLCDLKILAETGRSPNLVRDKARLIASAAKPIGA